jgi:hypothetical protein
MIICISSHSNAPAASALGDPAGRVRHRRDGVRYGKVQFMTEGRRYEWVLNCPCGESLTGASEDEIVDVSFAHLREKHPDMADDYEREHILFMATKYVRT